MRISYYSGGLTIYDVMISITSVENISGVITLSLLPLLDRSEFVNTVDKFKETIPQAKWLALTKPNSHRINTDSGFLILQKKSSGRYQTVSQEKLTEEISVSANHWPLFRAFDFPSRGSIVIENEDYCIKSCFQPDRSYSPDCS